jgi:glycosyltransferase involved in cell wall biosynthesis
MIPHGVPDVPFDAGKKYKYELGLNENTILTTFGLLHRGKGIEFIIKAMPELVKKHPELILLVLGTTHPHIRKLEGEAYHKSLQELVRRLNLEKHVCFKNRFLEPAELDRYLSATDIYISPFLGQEQTVSATLSYALGYGKAIISTPYLFAQEVLSQSRGLLVEVQDSNSIYEAIIKYLDEPGFMNRVRQAAYTYGHKMAWKNIGLAYSELFKTVLNSGSDFNNFSENPESGLRLV